MRFIWRWLKRLLVLAVLAIAVGVWWFWTADMSRDELVAKYGQPPSQFMQLDGGATVHYRDQGFTGGTPVVLLHGSNASLHTWEDWVYLLGDEYRVITLDLPSHGLTGATPDGDYSQLGMARFVDAFVTKLGLTQFVLGGNSMGGGVAARYAAMFPQKVTKLILVDAGGIASPVPRSMPLAFRLARTPVINQLFLHVTPRFTFESSLRDAMAKDEVITDEMIDRYYELALLPGSREATLARLNTPPDDWLDAHLQDITAPTLVLWGGEDHWVPIEVGDVFNKRIADSQMVILSGVGHIPMEEAPEESAAQVSRFLRD